jgi:hypothetical protein
MENLALEQKLELLSSKIDALLEQEESGTAILEDSKMMDSMGRITIPKAYRRLLGIDDAPTEMKILLVGKDIVLRKM